MAPKPSGVREILTWERFGRATRALAEMVAADGYRPDLVLAIARGGLFVAGALGYALDVKNVDVCNVEYYTGGDTRLELPLMLPPLPAPVALSAPPLLSPDD